MDEKMKKGTPWGVISTNGKEYYLLDLKPIVKDSWQGDNCYTFLVTPTKPIAIEQIGHKAHNIFGYARHIVTNNFTIEYLELDEIYIIAPDEINYQSNEKEIEEDAEKVDYPF